MSIQILQANDNANFTYSDIVAMAESSHVCNNRDCLEEYCEPVWEPVNCIGYCEGTKCNWRYAEPKEGNGDT